MKQKKCHYCGAKASHRVTVRALVWPKRWVCDACLQIMQAGQSYDSPRMESVWSPADGEIPEWEKDQPFAHVRYDRDADDLR